MSDTSIGHYEPDSSDADTSLAEFRAHALVVKTLIPAQRHGHKRLFSIGVHTLCFPATTKVCALQFADIRRLLGYLHGKRQCYNVTL